MTAKDDTDLILTAVEDARHILGEYIQSGPRCSELTVERLIAVLDRQDLISALDRMRRRRGIRLVE
jgi:hypothetical protein